jgi:hypothetical protein
MIYSGFLLKKHSKMKKLPLITRAPKLIVMVFSCFFFYYNFLLLLHGLKGDLIIDQIKYY